MGPLFCDGGKGHMMSMWGAGERTKELPPRERQSGKEAAQWEDKGGL